jgi:hypothetical protein
MSTVLSASSAKLFATSCPTHFGIDTPILTGGYG